jgi:hypothetical protein
MSFEAVVAAVLARLVMVSMLTVVYQDQLQK